MLEEEDPDEAGPDHRLEAPLPASADEVAGEERKPERQRDPEQVETVDPPHEPVLVQVAPVLDPALEALRREEPADVRVPEPEHVLGQRVAVPGVRGVRVAGPVGERVVLAVVGDPLGERPLHRHAPENRPQGTERGARLEALVREEPVEADGDPQPAGDVEPREQHEVDRAHAAVPEQPDGGDEPERRHDDGHDPGELARDARPLADGLDPRHAGSSNGRPRTSCMSRIARVLNSASQEAR